MPNYSPLAPLALAEHLIFFLKANVCEKTRSCVCMFDVVLLFGAQTAITTLFSIDNRSNAQFFSARASAARVTPYFLLKADARETRSCVLTFDVVSLFGAQKTKMT